MKLRTVFVTTLLPVCSVLVITAVIKTAMPWAGPRRKRREHRAKNRRQGSGQPRQERADDNAACKLWDESNVCEGRVQLSDLRKRALRSPGDDIAKSIAAERRWKQDTVKE
jgi:hypothetical protein